MTAEQMWKASGLEGEYEAWSFGDDPDGLAGLVSRGIKTATCSAAQLYEIDGEKLPEAGEYSVILDSRDNAVCVIRTVRVYTIPFRDADARHAFMEGEGDRSLEYWRKVHRNFFTRELESAGLSFCENTPVVCEEFVKVFPKDQKRI